MDALTTLLEIEEYLPDKRIISVTEVGSGMWGMRELSSDYDLVVIYSENPIDILAGRKYEANLPSKHHVIIRGREYDFQYMEVGHLINLLKKGNINAIWALLSPIIIHSSKMHKDLKEYVKSYPTKAIMPSLEGMVLSQLSDAVKRASVRLPTKSLLTAMRTVKFGENVMYGEYLFNPISNDYSETEILDRLETLKRNMTIAKIYSQIPNIGLEDLLYQHRLYFLDCEREFE